MKKTSAKKLNKIHGFFRWTNLYGLDDHLLVENIGGYSADYRRFFYDDIISIIIYKDPVWKYRAFFNWVFVLLGTLFIGMVLRSKSPSFGNIFTLIVTGFLLIFPILDLLIGATSKGQIRTLTSTEDIILARRYRESKKVLGKIQKLVEERQGMVDHESMIGKSLEYISPLLSHSMGKGAVKKMGKIPTTKYNPLYSFFLILLFFEVIVSTLQMKIQGDIALLLSSFSVLLIIVNVIVLFKQRSLYIRKPLQILSWVSLTTFLSSLVATFVLSVIMIFDYGLMAEAQYISISYTDHRFIIMRTIYLGLEALLVAFGALISLKGHHSVYSIS